MSNPLKKAGEYWKTSCQYSDGTLFGTLYVFADIFVCKALYGTYLDNYLLYEFYKLNHTAKRNFITFKKQRRLWDAFNSAAAQRLFEDKPQFNKKFAAFIGREWLLATAGNAGAVEDFIRRLGEVIVKPTCGIGGKGIYKLRSSDAEGVAELMERLADGEVLMVEEVLRNEQSLSRIQPHSVNTLRLVTCVDRKGNVHIIKTIVRIGGSTSCVDNLHSGGITCSVDSKAGIIDGFGINQKGEKYICHPVSGTTLLGYQFPYWDQVHDFARRVALTEPSARYVGWDIAFTEKGLELIEGNTNHGAYTLQMCDHTGRYREIRAYL